MERDAGGIWRWPGISGLLLAGAYVSVPPLVPNLVAFVPLLFWLDADPARGFVERFRGGLVFGLVAYLIGLHWMYTMLEFSWLAAVLYVSLACAFAACAGLAIALAGWLRHRTDWSWGLVLPACWIPAEWARTWGDLRMTADHMAHSLAGYPFLVQFADLVGPYGVGTFMLVFNGLAFEGCRGRGTASGRRSLAVLLGLTGAILAYDAWAWTHPPSTIGSLRVGLVQPNIPIAVKHDDATTDRQWSVLDRLSRKAAEQGARLVAWPETARPWALGHLLERPESLAMPEVSALARETGAEHLVGVDYYRIKLPDDTRLYNASMVVRADGTIDPVWTAKTYLVPFVEGVPFRSVLGGLLEGRGGALVWLGGGFTPGPRGAILRSWGHPFGVLVCYEELFWDLSRELRNRGAAFIVIVTNDAWFGRSFFQRYQAETVRLRAIENRCAFVRVANTGISGFVDPLGRYRERTALDVETAVVDDVPMTNTRTVYGRVGDVVAWVWMAVLAVGVGVGVRRRPEPAPRTGGSNALESGRTDVGEVPFEGPFGD